MISASVNCGGWCFEEAVAVAVAVVVMVAVFCTRLCR
jgi:hypothetical protein